MDNQTAIQLFETKRVRTAWNEDEEEWYFSVVDVVGILTDSPDPKRYWSVLKTRLKQEGIESTTICSTLKLFAQDGKMYKAESLIINSVATPYGNEYAVQTASPNGA